MSQRKSWTQYEDFILRKLKEDMNIKKWSEISVIMGKKFGIQERTGKQCRQRYQNHLRDGIDKSPWNPEEELKLLDLHLEHGNKWVYIADQIKQFGNFRTGNNTKNYFMSLLKRSLRNFNKVVSSLKKPGYRPIEIDFVSKFLNLSKESREKSSLAGMAKLELCKKIQFNLRNFCVLENFPTNFSVQLKKKAFDTFNFIKELKQMNRKGGRKAKKGPFELPKEFQMELGQDSTNTLRAEREQHIEKILEAEFSQNSFKSISKYQEEFICPEDRGLNLDSIDKNVKKETKSFSEEEIFMENYEIPLHLFPEQVECIDISEFFKE